MATEQTISSKLQLQESEFESDKIAMAADREEAERMMSVYSGYDDGGYDPMTRNQLRAEGKSLPQFNIVKPKIKKLAGNLMKDFLDKDFVPVSGKETKHARTLKGMYLSDKRHFEYDGSYMQLVLNGLVHQGIEYVYIDTKFNPIGNIAFKSLNISNIIIDPNWKTDKSSDINVVWVVKYLTAKQISQVYAHKSSRIEELIQREVLYGLAKDVDEGSVMPYADTNSKYGDLHRVVEKHFLEVEAKTVKYKPVASKPVPPQDGSQPQQTESENVATEGKTVTRRIYKKVYRIQTTCPTLDPEEFLEDREAEIQIERLPFFPWSSDRFNGRNCGAVQPLEDAQTTLNKRERLATSMMESSAHGAHLIDPILFGTDMTLARQAIADFNKSDANIFTAPGALASNNNLIREVPKTQLNMEIYKDIDRMRGWMDQLSGQTASMDGVKESSHDTGVLMEQRIIQSNISLTVLYKGLEIHELQKAEAWYDIQKTLYADDYREFTPRGDGFGDEGTLIKVNERVYTEEGVQINNDLKNMPPFKIVIKQSKQGETVRAHDRAVNLDAMNIVSNPLKKDILETTVLETLADTDEQRERLKVVGELTFQAEIEKLGLEILQMRGASAQMQQQLAQGQQQLAQGQQQIAQGAQQQDAADPEAQQIQQQPQ